MKKYSDNIICVRKGKESTECPITSIKFLPDWSKNSENATDGNILAFLGGHLEVSKSPLNLPIINF